MQPVKLDPAPSRIAYRWHRLWLTPTFRAIIRVGIPACAVMAAIGFWFTTGDRIAQINEGFARVQASIEERPEFMVKMMAIDGASPGLTAAIRELTPLEFPMSSFDVDLEAIQQEIGALAAVKAVDVRIRAGGVLSVQINERQPVVIWRGPEGLALLDLEGRAFASLDARTQHPELPLIAGVGADAAVGEALSILSAAAPLGAQIMGLVRISETRWDLVLKDQQRILLPETDALAALSRVLLLNETQDLLKRDVTHIDMRDLKRPTLRLSRYASEELRAMKEVLARKDD